MGGGKSADRRWDGARELTVLKKLTDLKVKIFADGADLGVIAGLCGNPLVRGFTTNPTLMRRANVRDYAEFARDVLAMIDDRPVSLEVFSDDFEDMERQATELASWGANVYVKIPVMNTAGEFSGPLVRRLTTAGVRVNVTAVMTIGQVEGMVECLGDGIPSFVSVFAGRIADTGRDPLPLMEGALQRLKVHPLSELIWASPRELLNVFEADAIGCHIITVTPDILAKLPMVGRDPELLSLETVRMFREDAVMAGYRIPSAKV